MKLSLFIRKLKYKLLSDQKYLNQQIMISLTKLVKSKLILAKLLQAAETAVIHIEIEAQLSYTATKKPRPSRT